MEADNAPLDAVIVLDTETTDLKNPEIIEVAVMLVEQRASTDGFFIHANPLTESYKFIEARYKPEGPISLGAMATHHILEEDLMDCPPSSEFYIATDVGYVIGHNVDFDVRAAKVQHPVKRICTLAMAQLTWPELDSHTLGALMYHLKGRTPKTREALIDAHSARADVNFCFVILCEILRLNPHIKSWKGLWAFSEDARLPRKMRFGKHEGMDIRDLPSGYVRWMHSQAASPDDDTAGMYWAQQACEKLRDHSR